MPYDYDDQNIFAPLLRGEIPNDTIMESQPLAETQGVFQRSGHPDIDILQFPASGFWR